MRTIVAEESIARLVAGATRDRLRVVPRARSWRSRGEWRSLAADAVVEIIEAAGCDAVILARDVAADPGARALPELGRMMGRGVVRLPGEPTLAAWAAAVAAHPDFQGEPFVRRLECLVGAAAIVGSMPVLRPRALSRWAGRAWAACTRCPGGGPIGGRCGRCGAPGVGVSA